MVKKAVKRIWKILPILLLLLAVYLVVTDILLPLFHREVSEAFKAQVAEMNLKGQGEGGERIRCIDENEEALIWRLRMIGQAERSIVLATFDLRTDESGTDLCAALYQAAERGVRIQILVDGIYKMLFLDRSETLEALIAHENIEVRFYNPITPLSIGNVNYRMHDKYLIIDDRMYLLGGRNSNDIFLGKNSDDTNIDRDILVYEEREDAGESLKALQEYFSEIWNEPCVKEKKTEKTAEDFEAEYEMLEKRYEQLLTRYPDIRDYDQWKEATYEAERITLITNEIHDGQKSPQILYVLEQLCKEAKDVLIQTPYIICNGEMYETLEKIGSNASLRILINAVEKGSNPFGCTDYLNQKKKIGKTGAVVYELMNEYPVHTKTVMIDDRISVVGSYNLDMRSTYLDTEMMLVIDSPRLNSHLREMAEEYKKKSKEVLPDGKETEGPGYVGKELSGGKKIFYMMLRVITAPVRHLL